MNLKIIAKKTTTLFSIGLLLAQTPCFSQQRLKNSSSSIQQKRPTALINKFGLEVNYYGEYYSGIKAIAFEYIRLAFPNDPYTYLIADLEKLSNDPNVQDRFLYIFYRKSGSNLSDNLYLLCKDATTSIVIAKYCESYYKNPPKSVKDLKNKFDKIEQANNEEIAQEAIDNAQRVTDADSTRILKYVDSLNAQNSQLNYDELKYPTFQQLLAFVKRDKFSLSEMKDYLLKITGQNWNIELWGKEYFIRLNQTDDFEMSYNPSKHSLLIEISEDKLYNNLCNGLINGHYKKTVYHSHIPSERYKALYQNKDYMIRCTMANGGSMGNDNDTITISRSLTFKN